MCLMERDVLICDWLLCDVRGRSYSQKYHFESGVFGNSTKNTTLKVIFLVVSRTRKVVETRDQD